MATPTHRSQSMATPTINQTITTDILDNDERFVTFQSCVGNNEISKDNFSSTSKTVQQPGASSSTGIGPDDSTSAKPAIREKDPRYSLKQNLDKTETITLMRKDFDEWATQLTRPGFFEIRKDVENCLEEMGEVDNVSMADLFMSMAAKSGMRITPSAALAVDVKFDPEKAQRLYLESQGVKNKVDRLKVDGGLYRVWESRVQAMNSSPD